MLAKKVVRRYTRTGSKGRNECFHGLATNHSHDPILAQGVKGGGEVVDLRQQFLNCTISLGGANRPDTCVISYFQVCKLTTKVSYKNFINDYNNQFFHFASNIGIQF